MKEAIKTLSLLISFLVMLGCIYLEVDIQVLVSRTILTLIACYALGMIAYWLTSIMIGKRDFAREEEETIDGPRAEAKA